MVGTLAQMISLVSYGNEYLMTGIVNKEFKYHITFNFCRFVTFKVKTTEKNKFGTNEFIFGDANEWFSHLKDSACTKLRLLYHSADGHNNIPDYMSAGFIGGGGQWVIESIYKNKSVFWFSRWIVNRFGAQDDRIWEVTYTNNYDDERAVNIQYNLEETKHALLDTLDEIKKFAIETDRKFWADRFASAAADLNSENPTNDYHTSLIVEKNYSLIAKQLLASAQKAWVFGGMGWWNDYYYGSESDQERNKRLSEKLYSLICKSIIGAVNSF